MNTVSLRKLVVAFGLVVAVGTTVSTSARADDWGDRDWHEHGYHEREWREHEREREREREEWREHHYVAPPVVYASPGQGYYYAAPPPVVAVPSGLNIILPLNFR